MVYYLPSCALGPSTLRCWMTCLRTLPSMVFAVLSPLKELFDNCAQTKELTSLEQKTSFRKPRTKKQYVHFLAEKQCKFVFNAPGASNIGRVWERQIRTVCNILREILLLCPWKLYDSSLKSVFYEAISIVNCRALTVDWKDLISSSASRRVRKGRCVYPQTLDTCSIPYGTVLFPIETRIIAPDFFARSSSEQQGRRRCSGEGRRLAAQPMDSW